MSEIDTSPEAIAAIMEGVTPPPWCAGAHRWPEQVGCCPLVGRPFSAHRHLRNVAAANTEADIRFIAASRDLVPALSAERDALLAENERLLATPPEVTALVEALRRIAAPGYGLQGLMEDGASDAEIASYWAEKTHRHEAVARAAITEWEAAQK